jgi:hypothetical protein
MDDKIYIGDPMGHIYKHCYDMWYSEFQHVYYMDYSYSSLGREIFTASTTAEIHYSDRGAKLRTGNFSDAYAGSPVTQDYLYTIFDEVECILNIPMLKGHRRVGVGRRAAFINNDGTIVDLDGTSPVVFTDQAAGNYYVVIGHRNQLAVMSAVAVSLSSSSALSDFTTSQSQSYGTDALKQIGTKYAIYAGGGNMNKVTQVA